MPDDYASHLPVLRAMAKQLSLKQVLEFGAGLHSTPFFLSLKGLKRLVSVEDDPEWFDRIAEEFDDKRLELTRSFALDGIQAADFDLVFVDDGQDAAQRVKTLCWVLNQPHPPVVVHDAAVPEYAAVISELADAPATAVVWS